VHHLRLRRARGQPRQPQANHALTAQDAAEAAEVDTSQLAKNIDQGLKKYGGAK